MKLRLAILAVLLALAALAVAQTMEEPPPPIEETEAEELLPGQSRLAAVAPPALELGADLGNACICLCRQAEQPRAERWGHYERSIVSGCRWNGRVCVIDGMLGTIGACTTSPAPLG